MTLQDPDTPSFPTKFDFKNGPAKTFEQIDSTLQSAQRTMLGYPINGAYDFTPMFQFLKHNIINVGDSFESSNYGPNTKEIEREVLGFFNDIWGMNRDDTWGYITQAGTEGNLQGLFVGREFARGKPLVFYTCKSAHYSIFKIARLLSLNICLVDAQENGEMDYKDFDSKLARNLDHFVLVNLNLGTTMKGACDNAREVHRIVKKYGKEQEYYCHADGALSGCYLPFLESDLFFKAHMNSISVSGHKFLGIPFPCGIFMMKKKLLPYVETQVEYIGSSDCMISGSRNGHAALFMKYIIEKKGKQGFKDDIMKCLELAEYLVDSVPRAWRNQNSITVVFPKPRTDVIRKWQLATEGDSSHVLVMQHVTKDILDELILDLKQNAL